MALLLPKEPLTEEEQLKQFIDQYIDDKVKYIPYNWPAIEWKTPHKAIRSSSKLRGSLVDEILYDELYADRFRHRPTLKPTKKQAKLLRKFRKLKRFK